MRTIFNKTLIDIAKDDPRIHMILADIGYGEIEPFDEAFPGRLYNVGVAEQNMTGVACGMAMEGNVCITYSIANFPTLRCLEQIRNDVCYHNQNVKIVIIGGGVSYGPLGISHHSTEDIAIMRALPNIVVMVPCDCIEAEAAVHAMIEHDGPVYYRCGYKNESDIHEGPINFQIGKSIPVCDGDDIALFFTGPIGYDAKKAVKRLAEEGISVRLVSMHSIKPIDKEEILTSAKRFGKILTVEEHNLSGGFGSAVAEVLAEAGCPCELKRLALPDVYVSKVGSQEWLREQYGLGQDDIYNAVKEMLNK
ncbi:MAG: transketolase [Clostridia bacterium]|nr:transketolase [Clostridia bacterium]